MKKLSGVIIGVFLSLLLNAQIITTTSFLDEFSSPLGSDAHYTTLYPSYYPVLEREVTNERFKVVVQPGVNLYRPFVLGLEKANGGAGIDISAHPILKIHIVVPNTIEVPGNNNLKIGFYISDGTTLGEYDKTSIPHVEYSYIGLTPGTDIILTYDWTHAEEVDWSIPGATPTTKGYGPDLTHIKSIGISMNTNSTAHGTYYIKGIAIGDTALSSFNKESEKTSFKAYSSPDKKNITLSEQVETLCLINSKGVEIFRDNKTQTINTSQLKAGVYLIKTDKGSTTVVLEK